jgi:RNA polymerase sigma-70 factor (ECF subfamily)
MFPPTRWSLVRQVNGADDPRALRALDELLKTYWQPLYVYARRSGLDPHDSEDAVQAFCQSVIQRESLRSADVEMGKLRSFLLGAFQNHLISVQRSQFRQKRGGGIQFVSIDDAEASLGVASMESDTPDKAFDRRWAHTLLNHVLERLRAEFAERGKEEAFHLLKTTLVWNGTQMSYDELGEKLGVSASAVAQKVKRLRARYRELLEAEIAETVDGPEAMAEERAHLSRVLSGG